MYQPSVHTQMTRYPIQLPVLYWRKTGTRTRAGAGWTRELSEEGATVELSERFEPQTLLRVRIQTDRGPIDMDAKIAWIAASAPLGAENYHGLTITQIAPDQLQALRDLLLPLSMVVHAGMRLTFKVAVTCRPKNSSGPPLRGQTGEVSRGGLLLRLPEAIAPSSVLVVTLQTGSGPLTLEGTIVWVQRPEARRAGELIDHGLRFTSTPWSVSLALGFLLAGKSLQCAEIPDRQGT